MNKMNFENDGQDILSPAFIRTGLVELILFIIRCQRYEQNVIKEIDVDIADSALGQLEVDKAGLDAMDRRYLRCIAEKYAGGPVGADTLSAALSEERDTIEEVIEPYLMQEGLVQRTPRGRMLSSAGFKHLGLKAPISNPTLFDEE